MKTCELFMRQGDCYIYRVDQFPEGEIFQDEMTLKKQVALGELSGHNHAFDSGAAVDIFKIKGFDGLTLVDAKEDSDLTHGCIQGFKGKESDNDYHWSLKVPKGKYIVGIVPESDWISKTIRRVVD